MPLILLIVIFSIVIIVGVGAIGIMLHTMTTQYMFYYTVKKYGPSIENTIINHEMFSISHRQLKKQVKEFNTCVNSDFWIKFSDIGEIAALEDAFFNNVSTQNLSLTGVVIRLLVLKKMIAEDYFLSIVFPDIKHQELIKSDDILQLIRVNIIEDARAYNNRIKTLHNLYERQYEEFIDTLIKVDTELSASVAFTVKELEETSRAIAI